MKKYLLAALGGIAFSTCLAAGAQIVVRIGPPPVRHEEVPVVPTEHPNWIWTPGYHRWDGNQYVWVPGRYAEPPYEHAHWVPGHWDRRGDGWVWVEGRWDRD